MKHPLLVLAAAALPIGGCFLHFKDRAYPGSMNTRFTPKPETTYPLEVEVRPAGSDAPKASIRLMLMGGGWKANR